MSAALAHCYGESTSESSCWGQFLWSWETLFPWGCQKGGIHRGRAEDSSSHLGWDKQLTPGMHQRCVMHLVLGNTSLESPRWTMLK